MKIKTISILAVLILAAFAVLAYAGEKKHQGDDKMMMSSAKVGEMAPDFTLTSAEGNEHSLSDFEGKYVILEWINFDCPFVKKHYRTGNMQKFQKQYIDKGAVWLSICSSAPGKQGYYSGNTLDKRIEQEGSKATAYLIDADGTVGKMYNAKTTPHMYIVNPEGTLIYAGAIDDKPTYKHDDIKGAYNYVVHAMSSSMEGNEVKTKMTPSYGCSVKY